MCSEYRGRQIIGIFQQIIEKDEQYKKNIIDSY